MSAVWNFAFQSISNIEHLSALYSAWTLLYTLTHPNLKNIHTFLTYALQGCIFCLTCSYPELTVDHVLTSAYVKIFRTITRNAVNKSVWRKKDCSWLPLNKHAMNIWLSSLRIRAHLSWRTGKHLHVLHVLWTYSTCSYPGYQATTTYAALLLYMKSSKTAMLKGCRRVLVENRMILACTIAEGSDHLRVKDIK